MLPINSIMIYLVYLTTTCGKMKKRPCYQEHFVDKVQVEYLYLQTRHAVVVFLCYTDIGDER